MRHEACGRKGCQQQAADFFFGEMRKGFKWCAYVTYLRLYPGFSQSIPKFSYVKCAKKNIPRLHP